MTIDQMSTLDSADTINRNLVEKCLRLQVAHNLLKEVLLALSSVRMVQNKCLPLKIQFNYYYFICVSGCFACMYICPLCVCLVLREAREDIGFPGTEV